MYKTDKNSAPRAAGRKTAPKALLLVITNLQAKYRLDVIQWGKEVQKWN